MAEWVCITECLPGKGVPVLITDGQVQVVATYDPELRWDGERAVYRESAVYWSPVGFDGHEWDWRFAPGEITHWMPLPALPLCSFRVGRS